jgi:hypothetical protein
VEYLVEMQWTDPTASRVAAVLSSFPDGVQPTTSLLPAATSRGFCVMSADSPNALVDIVHAISGAGASVRVLAREESV